MEPTNNNPPTLDPEEENDVDLLLRRWEEQRRERAMTPSISRIEHILNHYELNHTLVD